MKASGTIGRWTVARRIVQVVMLVLYLIPVIAVGWGLFGGFAGLGGEEAIATPSDLPVWGSLASGSIFGISLVDPFATLQAILASKSIAAGMLGALPILVVYALVRGRAFCGWVCPVNLLLEFVDWLRGKLGLQVSERALPRRAKLFVAAGILVLSAISSVPVFEAISPVGALSRAVIFGSLLGAWTLVAIIVAGLFWGRRVWCRSLCPLGGFWQVVGTVGLVSVRIDHDACVHCNKCKTRCICDPEILDAALAGKADRVAAGDCMLCGRCVDVCPKDALHIGPALPRDLSL